MSMILLLGGSGQVGREVQNLAQELMRPGSNSVAQQKKLSINAPSSVMVNLASAQSVKKIFNDSRPDCVINCAAYTAVDKAEAEQQQAFAVNRDGANFIAKMCNEFAVPLLHVSTDYVFDGNHGVPYVETDATRPLNVYGESKLEGEREICSHLSQHIILRTSWVFGQYGNNFVKTMIRLGQERGELNIVNDQRGCPTPARSIAETLLKISQEILEGRKAEWGIYHYCGIPETSWFEFARRIFSAAHEIANIKVPQLNPIPTTAFPTPAIRPQQSVLSCDKIRKEFGIEQADWQTELRNVIGALIPH